MKLDAGGTRLNLKSSVVDINYKPVTSSLLIPVFRKQARSRCWKTRCLKPKALNTCVDNVNYSHIQDILTALTKVDVTLKVGLGQFSTL